MTRDETLEFLRQHQPLPSDDELSQEDIDYYDEVRKFLLRDPDPDPEAVPLLLNSFGDGSGFGVYQLVEDVIARFPREVLSSSLAKSLASEHRGIRYWNAQIAARFPDPTLVAPLAELLRERDHDIRYAAITALEQIGDDAALAVLRDALQVEDDEELRDVLVEVLAAKEA